MCHRINVTKRCNRCGVSRPYKYTHAPCAASAKGKCTGITHTQAAPEHDAGRYHDFCNSCREALKHGGPARPDAYVAHIERRAFGGSENEPAFGYTGPKGVPQR
ncbi:hypothetical protein PT974_04476 [Cladobotryum mycophilum]|uniref:Uncharacterized protein n=1 Tax=Cladobotryum mycophilum TaxID=491253 RepID=A0ABR0SWA3_9HYPO